MSLIIIGIVLVFMFAHLADKLDKTMNEPTTKLEHASLWATVSVGAIGVISMLAGIIILIVKAFAH